MTYGAVDFYERLFSDILCDVQYDEPHITENIIEGFYRAIDSWFDYHELQAKEYAAIRERVRQTLSV